MLQFRTSFFDGNLLETTVMNSNLSPKNGEKWVLLLLRWVFACPSFVLGCFRPFCCRWQGDPLIDFPETCPRSKWRLPGKRKPASPWCNPAKRMPGRRAIRVEKWCLEHNLTSICWTFWVHEEDFFGMSRNFKKHNTFPKRRQNHPSVFSRAGHICLSKNVLITHFQVPPNFVIRPKRNARCTNRIPVSMPELIRRLPPGQPMSPRTLVETEWLWKWESTFYFWISVTLRDWILDDIWVALSAMCSPCKFCKFITFNTYRTYICI